MFTAEYSRIDSYGTFIVTGNSAEELIQKLERHDFKFKYDTKEKIIEWCNGNEKKYYGANLNIRRGEDEMTEYTSL